MTLSQSFNVDWCVLSKLGPIPALFTMTSNLPNSLTVCATKFSTASKLVTSAGIEIALPPPATMPATTSFAAYSCRSDTTTDAPHFAKCIAVAFPLPDPAPVTMTILFFTSIFIYKILVLNLTMQRLSMHSGTPSFEAI